MVNILILRLYEKENMVEDLIKTLEEETITLVDPFIVYTNITVCNFQYAFDCSIVYT